MSDDFDGDYRSLSNTPQLPEVSADLVALSQYVEVSDQTVRFVGANEMIQNGMDSTNCPTESDNGQLRYECNGLGNLIIGYNEAPALNLLPVNTTVAERRSGSHNIVVGQGPSIRCPCGFCRGCG